MAWYLSPSGWPTYADTPPETADLTRRGYTPITSDQVQAAIDAFNAGTPAPAPGDFLTEQSAAAAAAGSGPLAVALRAAYGAPMRTLRPNGNRIGVIGDSLMSFGDATQAGSMVAGNGPTIWKQVELLTRQRIQMTDPVQDPGDTIDDALNTQLPALLARSPLPNACVVAIARNNASTIDTAFFTKYEQLCDKLAAAGIVPLLATPMPTGNVGAPIHPDNDNLLRLRTWLRVMGPRKGYPVFDQYAALVDVTGGIAAAYDNGGGTHLTRAGYQAVADSIIAQGVPALFPPAPVGTIRDTKDPFDLFAGSGLFTSASPTGWAAAGATASFVTPAAGEGLVGRWLQFLKPAGTSADTAYRGTFDGVVVPGHKLRFSGNLKGNGFAAAGLTLQLAVEWRTAGVKTSADTILNLWQRDEVITFSADFTAPAGVDGVRLIGYQKGTPATDAATLINAVSCRDLTLMNLPA